MSKSAAKKVASAKATANAKQTPPAAKEQSPQEIARINVEKKVTDGIGVTLHTNGKPIKGLAAEPQLVKPTRKQCRIIDKIIGHPGKGNCIKRFHLYKEGMTLLDCKVTAGLVVSDVTFYAQNKYLTLRDATDEEYAKIVADWEKSKA